MSAAPSPRDVDRPVVATVTMGYGHLRAARALADHLGAELVEVDRAPWAGSSEQRGWRAARRTYEALSRASQVPVAGRPFLALLDRLTAIGAGPPHRPPPSVRFLRRQVENGLGAAMVERLARTGRRLVTTFYVPAVVADHHRMPADCVVTDTDLHRIWVPAEPAGSRIRYLAPSDAAVARLASYGVAPDRVVATGFPLPDSLASAAAADAALAQRRGRIERARRGVGTLHLTFAVGGAGAQARRAHGLLRAVRPQLRAGRLRVTLVAGTRGELARRFRRWAREETPEGYRDGVVDVLEGRDFGAYYERFNRLLSTTDLLWTKPGELVFYAALGLPLLLDRPVGRHEHANLRWAVDAGAAAPAPRPEAAAEWLGDGVAAGTLEAMAEAGFGRLPRDGARRIAEVVGG